MVFSGGKRMLDYDLVERFSKEELSERLDALAARINADYQGKALVVVGVLNGAFILVADLVRRLSMPVQVDFVRLASYGKASQTSGSVRITKDVELSVEGSHVLIVEDIVDTGITLAWYLDHLRHCRAESVKVCALIDKFERRQVEIPLDYVGIRVDSGFLVGYGLDFAENHRNLPAIFEVIFKK
jgi:hypoxanthine phosphoribosyltransferase